MKLPKIFKRKTSQDDGPDIVGQKIVYKLEKKWNDKKAKLEYQLYYGEQFTWSNGHKDMNPFYLQMTNRNYDGWIFKASGDLAWAKRQAKHYKLELPK